MFWKFWDPSGWVGTIFDGLSEMGNTSRDSRNSPELFRDSLPPRFFEKSADPSILRRATAFRDLFYSSNPFQNLHDIVASRRLSRSVPDRPGPSRTPSGRRGIGHSPHFALIRSHAVFRTLLGTICDGFGNEMGAKI